MQTQEVTPTVNVVKVSEVKVSCHMDSCPGLFNIKKTYNFHSRFLFQNLIIPTPKESARPANGMRSYNHCEGEFKAPIYHCAKPPRIQRYLL